MKLLKNVGVLLSVGMILMGFPVYSEAAGDVVYATDNVNIRTEPTTESESIGCLLEDEPIERISEENTLWSKVLYDGKEYYICSLYLTEDDPLDDYILLGEFKITAYCGGSCCNGKWAGRTSTGVTPIEGITIAVAPWIIPYGTDVYIEGVGHRVAQDTGGFANRNDHQIDLYFSSHGRTSNWGVQYRNIWIKIE